MARKARGGTKAHAAPRKRRTAPRKHATKAGGARATSRAARRVRPAPRKAARAAKTRSGATRVARPRRPAAPATTPQPGATQTTLGGITPSSSMAPSSRGETGRSENTWEKRSSEEHGEYAGDEDEEPM